MMSEMYDEDQPWHLTQEPKEQPSYEELADRIEELEAKLEKAVWRLEQMRDDDTGYRHVVHFRRGAAVTLAALKGQDDE